MTEPRLQHTSKELQVVARLLDMLNEIGEDNSHDLTVEGEITIWWDMIAMGEIRKDDCTWCYYPYPEHKDEGDVPEHD